MLTIGLITNMCAFLAAITFFISEVLHILALTDKTGKWAVIARLYPLHLGLIFFSAALFLISSISIFVGIRDSARAMKFAYPSGLNWTIKIAAFSAGAALLNLIGLPVFYSGTYVHGGRELLYYILIMADAVFISFASIIGLLAFTGAYSIPEKRRIDED
ncbi:MAG: hypothetical protein ACYS8W_16080 [Planctomycetota bacterium]